MAMGPVNIRSLCLTAVLLLVTIVLFTSSRLSSDWALKLVGPDYHPPAHHQDPPLAFPDPGPLPYDIFESAEVAAALNEFTESDLLSEDDEVMFAGDEARPIYELGKLQNPKAEEESNGDDWMESYQPGIDAETYKNLAPEEDGNKVYHQPLSKDSRKG